MGMSQCLAKPGLSVLIIRPARSNWAAYYDGKQDFADSALNTHRWTGGVVYTYGPGMTFRGSVAWAHHSEDLGTGSASADKFNSTNFLLGTQI